MSLLSVSCIVTILTVDIARLQQLTKVKSQLLF